MRIDSAHISLSSQHTFSAARQVRQDLQVWDNRQATGVTHDTATLSSSVGTTGSCPNAGITSQPAERRYYLWALLLEALTGKKINIPEMLNLQAPADDQAGAQISAGSSTADQGWGVRYSSVKTYTENERTVFHAKGVVTADGIETTFSVSLTMARSYTESESTQFRAGDAAKDPLVLNLSDAFAHLQPGETIKFDLDLDGKTEDMPFPAAQSGFLVIDRNGNGTVDDGSELFGPRTGDGFQELAACDEDKNGWIDEADSAYGPDGRLAT